MGDDFNKRANAQSTFYPTAPNNIESFNKKKLSIPLKM